MTTSASTPITGPEPTRPPAADLGREAVHVAVGVIRNACGEVLIAQRLPGTHLAGYWEFPGGKLEWSESPREALARELWEELGIEIVDARPLLKIRHRYPERRVVLDVWEVADFSGEPTGRQGQALRWVGVDELPRISLPPANRPIAAAARLPDFYAILEPERPDAELLLANLQRLAENGIRFVQCRAKALRSHPGYRALTSSVVEFCHARGMTVVLNGDADLARAIGADGVHLSATGLMQLRERPLGPDAWVGASCHDERELLQAARIGVDFAVLGPVAATASHPDALPLGWQRFAAMVECAGFPVYALGGLTAGDLWRARHSGARGVAAVRAFLGDEHQNDAP